jgi:predicted acylesterase/phospholipase RssA
LIARVTEKQNDFVLADYFDFIGGTSTGAIIAAGLSLGWSVEKLTTMYRELGRIVFRKRKFLPLRAWSKYPAKPLRQHLEAKLNHDLPRKAYAKATSNPNIWLASKEWLALSRAHPQGEGGWTRGK